MTEPAMTEPFYKGEISRLPSMSGRFAAFIQSEIAKYDDVIRNAMSKARVER